MYAEVINGVVIRPLRNGETEVVQSVFDRLGPRSRLQRFGGAKNVLTQSDLAQLARVDGRHHVLVASVDQQPVGIARLVRNGRTAEIAVEVVDDMQGRGVGTVLMRRLAADATAAGVERLEASVAPENLASRRLLRGYAVLKAA